MSVPVRKWWAEDWANEAESAGGFDGDAAAAGLPLLSHLIFLGLAAAGFVEWTCSEREATQPLFIRH
jgi:hypothetical protein